MITVHILSLHPVLICPSIFAHDKHPKSFNMQYNTVAVIVSVSKLLL